MKKLLSWVLASGILLVGCSGEDTLPEVDYITEQQQNNTIDEPPSQEVVSEAIMSEKSQMIASAVRPPEIHTLTEEGIQLAADFLKEMWRLFDTHVGWRDHATGELYVQIGVERELGAWPGFSTNFEPNIPLADLPASVAVPRFFTNAEANVWGWERVEGPQFSRFTWGWEEDNTHLHGFYNVQGTRLTPPVLTERRRSEWVENLYIDGWTALDARSVYLFDFQDNGIPDILVNFGGWLMNHSHVDGVGGSGGAEGVLFSYIDGAFEPVMYVSHFSTDFFRDTQGNVLVLQHVNLYEGEPAHHVQPGFHQLNWDVEQGFSVTPVVLVEYWLDWEAYIRWEAHFWSDELQMDIFTPHPTLPETGDPLVHIWPLTALTQSLISQAR